LHEIDANTNPQDEGGNDMMIFGLCCCAGIVPKKTVTFLWPFHATLVRAGFLRQCVEFTARLYFEFVADRALRAGRGV
jgi:hypothetical protein